LAAVALPAYQDYTNRAKVSEVVLAASTARTCITEQVQSVGRDDANLLTCGGNFQQTRYASSLTIDDADNGVITVAGRDDVAGVEVELSPLYGTSFHITEWVCQEGGGNTAPIAWLPGSCR
jgi:type IV pilus assembly protein PilA